MDNDLIGFINQFLRDYDAVITSECAKLIELEPNQFIRPLKVIGDARSAVFYSLGWAKMNGQHSAVILSADEVPSSLTGLTEARYQFLPLVLFSLFPFGNHDSIAYCEQMVSEIILYNPSDETAYEKVREKIERCINKGRCKPIIVKVSLDTVEKAQCLPDSVMQIVVQNCSVHASVYTAGKLSDAVRKTAAERGIRLLERDAHYGAVSFFFGASLADNRLRILVASQEDIMRDINAYSLREMNKQCICICMIHEKNSKEIDIQGWVKSFDFKYIRAESVDSLSKMLHEATTAIVIEIEL